MALYQILLVVHVLDVFGMAVLLGMLVTCLWRTYDSGTVKDLRRWAGFAKKLNTYANLSLAVLFLTGLYLAMIEKNWDQAWIKIAPVFILLMGGILGGVVSSWLRKIKKELAPSPAELTPTLQALLTKSAPWIFSQVLLGLFLGAIILMVLQPEIGISVLILAISLAGGGTLGFMTKIRK
jgi:hypothetical protein